MTLDEAIVAVRRMRAEINRVVDVTWYDERVSVAAYEAALGARGALDDLCSYITEPAESPEAETMTEKEDQ